MATAEDRIKELSKRFNKRTEEQQPDIQQKPEPRKELDKHAKNEKSERRRMSLYFNRTVLEAVSNHFAKMQYELFPIKLDKAAYWEALIEYALAHQEEVKQEIKKSAA
jgi:hypothetical protein